MTFAKLLSRRIPESQVRALVCYELERILSACEPEKVILFGSAAQNQMTEASDLDFLIVLAPWRTSRTETFLDLSLKKSKRR